MKPDNQPAEITYVRGKLCEHCCEFILRYEPVNRNWQTLDIKLSDIDFARGSPPVREMNAVKVGAEAGCWICNHLTSNALRDQNGHIYPFRASVYSYTIGAPGFIVDLFENKKRVIYRERFRLSSSKQITDSTPEGKTALRDAFISQLSKQGNGSVEAPKNAYTQGGAVKRKLSRTSEDYPRDFGSKSLPEATGLSTWSSGGSQKAREWLEECDEKHTKCRAARKMFCTTSYPLRLIEVSTFSHGFLKLIHSSSLPPGVRYATLSHCWGRSKQGVLLRSRLNAYQQHISNSSIPKTFREAAKICLDLQLNYLWIDSLCIVQDDLTDWSQEAPCMAEIYTNSYVTLGATASWSDNGGLERPFNPCHAQSLAFSFVDTSGETCDVTVEKADHFQQNVVEAPLNRRGWVLQERSLSPRLIHFATDQLYWECPASIDAQFELNFDDIGGRSGRTAMKWLDMDTEYVEEAPEAGAVQPMVFGRPAEAMVLAKWHDLIKAYSACSLSYSSDKLMAISGLANRVLSLTSWPNTEYLAGMWRKDFPRCLLWATSKPLKTEKLRGIPSWSWASVNEHYTEIFLPRSVINDRVHQDKVEIFDISGVPVNVRLASIEYGVIRLRGNFCRIKLWMTDLDPAIKGKVLGQRESINLGRYLDLTFDCVDRQPLDVFERSVFFLPVVHSTLISKLHQLIPGDEHYRLTGLMLEPTTRKAGEFRRVGRMSLEFEDIGKVGWAIAEGGIQKNFYLERDSQGKYIFELV